MVFMELLRDCAREALASFSGRDPLDMGSDDIRFEISHGELRVILQRPCLLSINKDDSPYYNPTENQVNHWGKIVLVEFEQRNGFIKPYLESIECTNVSFWTTGPMLCAWSYKDGVPSIPSNLGQSPESH